MYILTEWKCKEYAFIDFSISYKFWNWPPTNAVPDGQLLWVFALILTQLSEVLRHTVVYLQLTFKLSIYCIFYWIESYVSKIPQVKWHFLRQSTGKLFTSIRFKMLCTVVRILYPYVSICSVMLWQTGQLQEDIVWISLYLCGGGDGEQLSLMWLCIFYFFARMSLLKKAILNL